MEAQQLFQIWKRTPANLRGTQAVFGELHEIGTQGAVGQFLRGETPLSLKAARGFAAGLKCEIADFSPRLAAEALKNAQALNLKDEDFEEVQHLDVQVAAGHGSEPQLEEVVGTLKFRREFLQACGVSAANGAIVNVRGASMEPTIPSGAVLLVNRAQQDPRVNSIYVFWKPDGLVVKRLVKDGERWVARSDNGDRQAFPDFPLDDGYKLLGRAVWVGAKL